MTPLYQFAQREAGRPLGNWLAEHPLVAGLAFLAIGVVMLGVAVFHLRRGFIRDKEGNEIRGAKYKLALAIYFAIAIGVCGIAIYGMVAG